MFSRLQYISQGISAADQLMNIERALEAGTKWIQLRFKSATSDIELQEVAIMTKALCTRYNATFIVNDHPHVAKAVLASGVHLGLKDIAVRDCRKILGNDIIGGTANTFEDVIQRVEEGCDYIGVGPYRYTTTKENLSPVIGLQGFRTILDKCKLNNISVPIYAVGGILLEDVEHLINAGVYGIAVSGMITNHWNRKVLLENLNQLLS